MLNSERNYYLKVGTEINNQQVVDVFWCTPQGKQHAYYEDLDGNELVWNEDQLVEI